MAEKKSAKKLLALLLVLVIFSLVVDLLYLNMLYDIAKSDAGLKGSLATLSYEEFSSMWEQGRKECLDSAMEERDGTWKNAETKKNDLIRIAKESHSKVVEFWESVFNNPNSTQQQRKDAGEALISSAKIKDASIKLANDEYTAVYNQARERYQEDVQDCEEGYSDENKEDQWDDMLYEQEEEFISDSGSSSEYAEESSSYYESSSEYA